MGYALVIVAGAVCLLASLIPLAFVPGTSTLPPRRLVGWRALVEPLRNARFRTLLAFRGWFGLANGITQTAQAIYPKADSAFRPRRFGDHDQHDALRPGGL